MIECTSCSNLIGHDSLFCGHCGAKLTLNTNSIVNSIPINGLDGAKEVHSSDIGKVLFLPISDNDKMSSKILVKEYKSSEGDEIDRINYEDYSCTCQEWNNQRSLFSQKDIRRLCKHMIRKFPIPLKNKLDILPLTLIESYASSGVPIWSKIGCYLVKDKYAVLIKKTDSEWLDVMTVSPHEPKKRPYAMFGFNPNEKRWSYGEGPKNAQLLKEIIGHFIQF